MWYGGGEVEGELFSVLWFFVRRTFCFRSPVSWLGTPRSHGLYLIKEVPLLFIFHVLRLLFRFLFCFSIPRLLCVQQKRCEMAVSVQLFLSDPPIFLASDFYFFFFGFALSWVMGRVWAAMDDRPFSCCPFFSLRASVADGQRNPWTPWPHIPRIRPWTRRPITSTLNPHTFISCPSKSSPYDKRAKSWSILIFWLALVEPV